MNNKEVLQMSIDYAQKEIESDKKMILVLKKEIKRLQEEIEGNESNKAFYESLLKKEIEKENEQN